MRCLDCGSVPAAAPVAAASVGRYVPKFMPPGMAAAMGMPPPTADAAVVKQEPLPMVMSMSMPPPAAAPPSMGPPRPGGSDRKPRKIDMMLQTLKRRVSQAML